MLYIYGGPCFSRYSLCVERVVHELVFVLIGAYLDRAQIVLATTTVHFHLAAQIAVRLGNVTSAAPFGACVKNSREKQRVEVS